ncbi:MAG: c-type cytochrome [Steroidobacterales bacterium]
MRIQRTLLFVVAIIASGLNTAGAANGEPLYANNCGICHQPDGAGAPGVAPPLHSDLWPRLGSRSPRYFASVLISGLVGMPIDGQVYPAAMPSWAQLSDAEISAIGTFVLQKLNGTKLKLPEAAVKETRAATLDAASLKRLRDGD